MQLRSYWADQKFLRSENTPPSQNILLANDKKEKPAPDQTKWSEENTERVKNLSWKENIATSKILQIE